MKLPFISKRADKGGKAVDFSDFFLHAPEKEKLQVLREAARQANEDQRRLIEEYEKKVARASS